MIDSSNGEYKQVKMVDESLRNNILDLIYPIGSIYMSKVDESPSSFLGGTWEKISGRFLYASDDNHACGTTGGEETHTLTVNEMPSHNHSLESISGYDDHNFINGDGQFHIQNSDTTVGFSTAVNAQYYYGFTGSSGSSQAHNNMPPYLSVYMWERIA